RVYLIANNDDAFWLSQVFGSIAQNTAPLSGHEALSGLLATYGDIVQGCIIYDPNLIDTINVATMLAGQRDGVVVSPAQAEALQHAYHFPVLVDLRKYGWKSRLQVYRWALENLLETSSDRMVAGLDGRNVSGLRSFLVATRTFIYWLDSRSRQPRPGHGRLSERALMRQILHAYPPSATHLGWFIDESSGVKLTSEVAMAVLATDHCTNLEVWAAVQPQKRTVPAPMAEVPQPENKVYVSFTMSEGDNLQYCQHHLLRLWQDAERGSLPIGWTISPVLLQAAPAMAEYYLRTMTPNDELIAGPSGAGYIFPSHWPAEHLAPFLQRTGRMMQAMGMTTLQVLDTGFWQSSGLPFAFIFSLAGMAFTDSRCQLRYAQELATFGVRGILSSAGKRAFSCKNLDGMPLYQNLGLAGNMQQTVRLIRAMAAAHQDRPLFLNVYMLAWSITPSDLKQVVQQLGDGYEIVLPKMLLAMLAKTI
ncbi:MAG TPA: hypothetical protein VFU49_01435, partial [Ktedonobacteraceae bacterium]|nr:hypothetical protein [Ktedonobacteraceae bacterium]